MYFRRVSKLDLPVDLRTRIVDEIDRGIITPTGMNELKSRPPWEETVERLKSLPDHRRPTDEQIEYIKTFYWATNIVGYEFSNELSADIYKHYDSFFSMVPDEPKIIIKFVSAKTKEQTFNLHNGKLQTASLTCVIKGQGPETVWYEPKPEFFKKYRAPTGKLRNIQGIIGYHSEVERITSIKMNPWEMIFFDHNSLHEVEGVYEGLERILFSMCFLNITQTELEDIYDEWWVKNNKD